MKHFAFVALLLLAGCSEEAPYLNGKLVCEPATGKAFYLRQHVGDTLFARRTSQADSLCKQVVK